MTGKPFKTNTGILKDDEKKTVFLDYVEQSSTSQKAESASDGSGNMNEGLSAEVWMLLLHLPTAVSQTVVVV